MLNQLAEQVLEMCKRRGWSLYWTARGAYLHLESSELIEAARGKDKERSRTVAVRDEAADVLIVLMSITENAGVDFDQVIYRARDRVAELMSAPRYAGEDYDPNKPLVPLERRPPAKPTPPDAAGKW